MTRAADVALSVARGARRESLAVGASIRVASHNPGRKGDHSALLKSRQRAAYRCLTLRCCLRDTLCGVSDDIKENTHLVSGCL